MLSACKHVVCIQDCYIPVYKHVIVYKTVCVLLVSMKCMTSTCTLPVCISKFVMHILTLIRCAKFIVTIILWHNNNYSYLYVH